MTTFLRPKRKPNKSLPLLELGGLHVDPFDCVPWARAQDRFTID